MTQTNQERSAAFTGGLPESSVQPLLVRMAGWQRAALYCAGGGAATILVCALALARPLPSVGPPPPGIAPLLSSAAPQPSSANSNSNSVVNVANAAIPAAPVSSSAGAPPPTSIAQSYFVFLRQIDQQRAAMLASLSAALAGAGQAGTPQEFAGFNSAATALAQSAQALQSAFQAQSAPPALSTVSTLYSKLLQDQCGIVAQTASSISGGDLRGAFLLVSESQRQIQTDALAADQALGAAATSLQTAKPFTIAPDAAQNSAAAPAPQGTQPGGIPIGAPATPLSPSATAEQPGRTPSYAPAASSATTPQPGGGQGAPNSISTPAT